VKDQKQDFLTSSFWVGFSCLLAMRQAIVQHRERKKIGLNQKTTFSNAPTCLINYLG